MIKTILKKILPPAVVTYIKDTRGIWIKSFSQEGEDMILRNLFAKKINLRQSGFYVDVGAHDPFLFSNTCFFYRLGWRGINIDAMPGSMQRFERIRKRDINLEEAVASKSSSLTFYAFNEPALNTFSTELAEERLKLPKYKLTMKANIQTRTLESILGSSLPKNQSIDFLTVDVEGLDLDVLKSNNWQKYRPTVVLAESYSRRMDDILTDPIYSFLTGNGYYLFAKTVNTMIFTESSYQFELY